MANTQYAFLKSGNAPTHDQLQQAIARSGFDLKLDPECQRRTNVGFVPCTLNGVAMQHHARTVLASHRRLRSAVIGIVAAAALAVGVAPAEAQQAADKNDARPYARLVTAETLAEPARLAALETPGKVFFEDGFESAESLENYFEIRGLKEGRARLVSDPKLAHSGSGALELTAVARDGRESGTGATGWFGPEGYDRVHLRCYLRFAPNYDQGNLNHTGGGLAAVAGANRWAGMGMAGQRPRGDDRFNARFEPWRDWGRLPAPGYMFLYTYWMDMRPDRQGNYYGNMLGPEPDDRIVPERGRWTCLEHMIRANDPGKANGELAAWIDGTLYIHYTGIRWRTTADVKIKRFNLDVYIHRAEQDNTVWYDDVALSTGYIGPK